MLIDVIVPGPWWNALTYEAERSLALGARVRVPVARTARVGFVLGPAEPLERSYKIRHVAGVIDEQPVLEPDLWKLALWMGQTWLCGPGLALTAMCPPALLNGELLPVLSAVPGAGLPETAFHETCCFDPHDGERREFYLQEIQKEGRTLVLFPEARQAKTFFASLPASIRAEALLWPSTGGKKLRDAWIAARSGNVRVIVAPPGGVFAPLSPHRILVDEEASPAYVFQRPPHINARSVAGQRAMILGAGLVLGGRIPSSKTFLRSAPACEVLPDRKRLIFVDRRRSIKGTERGVEGTLPLTISLLERTRAALAGGSHVLWVLDRHGEAAEVFCAECGHAIRCPRCGGMMRSENGGQRLRCVLCGLRKALPDRCPDCRGKLWTGRRPGLEALAAMAGRLVRGWPTLLYDDKTRTFKPDTPPSLILGTRGALALCDALDVGLAAWLDLDAELRRPEYGARFQAFSMVWESCWRGGERDVLIQGCGSPAWRDTLARGWGQFWKGELAMRKELDLPPFGLMIRIDPRGDREALSACLEKAELFVLDPGDGPLWVNARSAEPVARALAWRFEISRSRAGFPCVTVSAD